MKAVATGIQAMQTDEIKSLEINTSYLIPHTSYLITPEDVEIVTEDMPGYLTAQDGDLIVALDITLTDELRKEGIARDFVNRVQNYRKDSGFDVTDKISIQLLNTNAEVSAGVLANLDYICQEVQAISLDVVESLSDSVTLEIDEILLEVVIVVV